MRRVNRIACRLVRVQADVAPGLPGVPGTRTTEQPSPKSADGAVLRRLLCRQSRASLFVGVRRHLLVRVRLLGMNGGILWDRLNKPSEHDLAAEPR